MFYCFFIFVSLFRNWRTTSKRSFLKNYSNKDKWFFYTEKYSLYKHSRKWSISTAKFPGFTIANIVWIPFINFLYFIIYFCYCNNLLLFSQIAHFTSYYIGRLSRNSFLCIINSLSWKINLNSPTKYLCWFCCVF